MDNTTYLNLAEKAFEQIIELIESINDDVEYEINGNILSLEFESGYEIIINKQEAMKEIWLASTKGGFHFTFTDGYWYSSKDSIDLLSKIKEELENN